MSGFPDNFSYWTSSLYDKWKREGPPTDAWGSPLSLDRFLISWRLEAKTKEASIGP
jgi:hypothetical protein